MKYPALFVLCNILFYTRAEAPAPPGSKDEQQLPLNPEENYFNYDTQDSNNLVIDLLATSNKHTYRATTDSLYAVTHSYSSKPGYFIRQVKEGDNLVWHCTNDFQSANSVDVYQKNSLPQLVSVNGNQNNVLLRRLKSKFVPVSDSTEFMELNKLLDTPDKFVDRWLELDLSNPNPNGLFFSSDHVYEDGVPKLKVETAEQFYLLRLYDSETKVKSADGTTESNTLWTYEDKLKCESVVLYKFENVVLLEMTLAGENGNSGSKESLFFKREDSLWHKLDKNEFDAKLRNLKSETENVECSLNLPNTTDETFLTKVQKTGGYKHVTLYPKTGYHLKKLLLNDTQFSALGNNERYSPVVVHFMRDQPVLVSANVWENGESKRALYFSKTDKGFVSIEKDAYQVEVLKLRVEENDEELGFEQSTSEDEESESEEDELLFEEDAMELMTRVKFNMGYEVDDKYFKQVKSHEGGFEVHSVLPKQKFVINLVDSEHGVVWKATEHNLQVRSLTLYFIDQKPKAAQLYIFGPRVNKYMYFSLTADGWNSITLTSFYRAVNKNDHSFQLFD